MLPTALVSGVLTAAYLFACALLLASIVIAGVSLYRGDLRNALLLWLCALPLFVVLWSIPRLRFYIAYGVHAKVVTYTTTAHLLALLAILIAAFLRGRIKWLPITSALIGFALVSAV